MATGIFALVMGTSPLNILNSRNQHVIAYAPSKYILILFIIILEIG